MSAIETGCGKVALAFAKALVSGDYSKAYSLIALPEKINLEQDFTEMIEYGEGPVNHIELMNEMDSWPGKQQDDLGWVYVALSGENFSEAVSVVVSKVKGAIKITEIEWGRP